MKGGRRLRREWPATSRTGHGLHQAISPARARCVQMRKPPETLGGLSTTGDTENHAPSVNCTPPRARMAIGIRSWEKILISETLGYRSGSVKPKNRGQWVSLHAAWNEGAASHLNLCLSQHGQFDIVARAVEQWHRPRKSPEVARDHETSHLLLHESYVWATYKRTFRPVGRSEWSLRRMGLGCQTGSQPFLQVPRFGRAAGGR